MAHNIEAILTMKDNMSATLKVAESNLKTFGKSIQRNGKTLKTFGSKMGYLGKDLMKLNAPFLAVGGWATKLGMDFEAVTSSAQSVMNIPDEAMDPFIEKAREVGQATSKSATESMEAIQLLAQSGMSQKDILETTYPLVRLSEAGNLDMARSADLLTNSMKSAGIPIQNTSKYLDQVAKSANIANTDIEQQMEAWNTAGGSIQSANMRMSEANALLGVMANRGVKGTEAGNTLSRVFQNLNATTGEAGKAMQQLGIETANSDGSMRNKIDVLRELKEKTDGMTESQREQYLTMIGGKAHTENLKKMLDGLGDEYDDLKTQLEGANGALETMAIVMKDNLKGKLETLSSSMQEFGLKLAESLVPMLEKAADGVQTFVDKLNDMDQGQLDSIINVVAFSTKLALLLIGVGGGIKLLGQFGDNFGYLITSLSEGGRMATLLNASGLKLGFTLGVIGLAVAAVVKHWDKIGPAVREAYEAIKEFITGSPEIMGAFAGLKEAIGGVIDGLATFIEGALQTITAIFSGDGAMLKEGLVNMFKGGIEVVKNLWQGLLHFLSIPIEAVVKLIEGPFPGVAAKLRSIWGGLKSFLSNPAQAVSRLRDMASAKMEKVKSKWGEVKSALGQAAKGKAEAITNAFHSAVKGVRTAWKNLKDFLRNPIKGTVQLAQKGANWVKGKIGNNWQGTSSWRGGLTTLHEKGGEIFDLPGDTRVYPHDKSVEMAFKDGQASSGGGVVVNNSFNMSGLTVREDADIDRIAESLANKIEKTKFNMA